MMQEMIEAVASVENHVPDVRGIYGFFASHPTHNNGEPVCLLVGKSEKATDTPNRLKYYLSPNYKYADCNGTTKSVFMDFVFWNCAEMLHAASWKIWCELLQEVAESDHCGDVEAEQWERRHPVILQARKRMITKGLNLGDEGRVWKLDDRPEATRLVKLKLLEVFKKFGMLTQN